MNWRTLATLTLLAGALLTGWVLWSQRDRDATPASGQTQPDYILNDFEMIALDKQGQEAFTVRAPRLERDPDSKTMDIETPLFIIPSSPDSGGGTWEVRSQTGWVSERGDEIRLRGQVQADSGDADGRPVTMRTEQLDVFPQAKRATSAVKVTLTQPGLIMTGHTLEADLERNRITLQDTRTRYESIRR
ncbi:LPS export ABC transporter periplasmic protein LptC [Marilutibacter alkalisoli]|uniref:LPS export ABC transporter periplasmic protein LptC n=1 Tax=Marilutibacter alkalisoli TaxID=2591633 RepID=A0A514BPN9_9GAMM|nr:LPS export ABC transporter periplasmic protein LptC [Lysobacter alkalisoli]QDH69340.1 LPS export ABC transporter periplasmic protein LptC [Lysobacter alkalisoli]